MAAIKKNLKKKIKVYSCLKVNPMAKTEDKLIQKAKINIKTDCLTFAKPILNKSFNFTQAKCSACAVNTKQYCLADSKYAKIEGAKERTRGTNSDKYNTVFDMLLSGTGSSDIQKALLADFTSEGACKSFVATCSASYNAVINIDGKSKMAAYARFLVSTAKNPKKVNILPKSRRFTLMAHNFVKAQKSA